MKQTTSRIIKWAFVNFWRNSLLSVAATLVMTLALLTVSVSVILNLVVGATVESINSKIDLVIYFKDSASEEQILALFDEVSILEDVKSVDYIDKEKALEKFKDLKIDPRLKDIAEESNRLPRSFEIEVVDPSKIDGVANFFKAKNIKPLIEDTSLTRNRDKIEKLSKITRFVRIAGISFSVVFILVSILIVYNTIKLTIFTRREEIEVMKLVGASVPFIRWPFIVEGMLYGVIATLISTLLIYLAFYFVSPTVSTYFGLEIGALRGSLLSYFIANLWIIVLLELFVGLVVSAGSSILAMKKYLEI